MGNIDYCSLINHLSSNEKEELYERYIQHETISTLITEYQIDVSPALFYKIFSPIEHNSDKCSSCRSESIISKRPTKNGYKGWYHLDLICTACGSVETVAQKLQRLDVEQHYATDEYRPIELSSLTFSDRIYLLTLLRGRASQMLDGIEPIIP